MLWPNWIHFQTYNYPEEELLTVHICLDLQLTFSDTQNEVSLSTHSQRWINCKADKA